MTAAALRLPRRAIAVMPIAAEGRPALNLWVFGAPYLASIIYFFIMIKDDSRIYAPVFPLLVVAAVALVATIIERRLPWLNTAVLLMVLVYAGVCLISITLSLNSDSFALRKMGLPLVGMAPAIFRFYVTPRQLLAFLLALAWVAYVYTTQTSDMVGDGFFSTDSPNESILGVAFGALTVWLAASRRSLLAALSYGLCIFFFKRNAIVAALAVSALVVAFELFAPRREARLLARLSFVALAAMATLAFYLSDFFDLVAGNLLRGYDSEFLSVGRTPIYDAILYNFTRSTLSEQILGHGAGAVEHLIANQRSINPALQLAHNEYLSWLYDFGIAGLVVLLAAFSRLARDGAPTAALLLFMALSMSGENFFLVSFNCLAVFTLFSTRIIDPRART
jgi:hypothetical protein